MKSFSIKSSKKILTSNSDLVLFGDFCHKIRLNAIVKKIFPSRGNRGYFSEKFIEPLILTLHAGGKHIEDICIISRDLGLRTLLKLNSILSSPAIGRWLKDQGNENNVKYLKFLNKKILNYCLETIESEELTLDIDATCIYPL